MSPPSPRPHVLALAPYARAEPASSRSRRPILLNQNENATPPGEAALEAARAAMEGLGRYPDSDARPLREAIAAAEGLDRGKIICSAGSMELISLIAQAYLRPGDEALISAYGYLYFRTAARLCEANDVLAPERDLCTDVDAMLERVSPRTRLVFLANPNNPTGSLLAAAELTRLRAGLPEDVLLVIDGAYAEYVEAPDYDAGSSLVEASDNTVMLRTFSKAHGLAGLRVGWGYFPSPVAEVIDRIRLLGNVASPAVAAARAAIADKAHVARVRRTNAELREAFAGRLRRLGLAPHASYGNFLLVPFGSPQAAAEAYAFLAAQNIMVRSMAPYGLAGSLRMTIGSADEMQILAETLGEWQGQHSIIAG